MTRKLLTLAASSLVLITAIAVSGEIPVLRSTHHDYRVVEVAAGLVNPWSMAFLPGGDILIT
jgi:hypothetical protein